MGSQSDRIEPLLHSLPSPHTGPNGPRRSRAVQTLATQSGNVSGWRATSQKDGGGFNWSAATIHLVYWSKCGGGSVWGPTGLGLSAPRKQTCGSGWEAGTVIELDWLCVWQARRVFTHGVVSSNGDSIPAVRTTVAGSDVGGARRDFAGHGEGSSQSGRSPPRSVVRPDSRGQNQTPWWVSVGIAPPPPMRGAWTHAWRPKLCRFNPPPCSCESSSGKLRCEWSPEQIAGWPKRAFPIK